MKYKIHDIISESCYPKSKEIFIPTGEAVVSVASRLCQDGIFLKEAIEIWSYEDSAFFEDPTEMCMMDEFIVVI